MTSQEPAGRWDPVFALPNVAIHAHVLPNGKVLFWGRRDNPGDTLDEHVCTPQVWDPATGASTPTPQPTAVDGSTVNLFCAGHAFLPDGRLLVAGGHVVDGTGIDQASLYDWRTNTWTALPPMKQGRWYPTVTALADGRALVTSGSIVNGVIADPPQIWDGTQWLDTAPRPALPLYPRMHVVPGGRVYMSGTNAETFFLDTAGAGAWAPLPAPGGTRPTGARDYAPSVQYEPGKVVYVGGGNDAGNGPPSATTELVDLAEPVPTWRLGAAMAFRRRQHNGTILADGTVLVTGGTSGPGFDDLTPGAPVHPAELWNPATGAWQTLAAEDVDRCYHSTTVLLPDGSVLSAGGGEFRNPDGSVNAPQDTHRDAQIFHPPYLFAGPRPEIVSATPEEVVGGGDLAVEIAAPDAAARITLLRLPSVTHAFDQNQRIVVPAVTAAGTTLTATTPADPSVCPPGHYMLFVLSAAGVPSLARIVRVAAAPAPPRLAAAPAEPHAAVPAMTTEELDAAVRRDAAGTPVSVGLTAVCPYGLGACWGGAYEALGKLDGVAGVRPIANGRDSTAEVYLAHRGLPDLDRWPEQLARWANASYDFRGVEVTVDGTVAPQDGALDLAVADTRDTVRLEPLTPEAEIRWDLAAGRPRTPDPDELGAYDRLRSAPPGDRPVRVTGPLRHTDGAWSLFVRAVASAG